MVLFNSDRDILNKWVNLYRLIRDDKKRQASKDELDLLGFLTHMKNNSNYTEHKVEIE